MSAIESSALAHLDDSWKKVWFHIKGRPAEVTRSVAILPDRVFDSGVWPSRFAPRKQYFSVVINELFLTQSRKWWNEYDPMALVVSEFAYDGKRTTVPIVVGPALLEGKVQNLPGGISITDTLVAGVHPYTGGTFALTVILAQIKRASYAKRLLQFVETVAGAFPAGVALQPHLKVAGAVMDGIESLFSMEETVPIAGHRFEYNDGISPWLKPGFFALISKDERDIDVDRLSVVSGRLKDGRTSDAPSFRQADFVLYSLCPVSIRSDVPELPFYRLFKDALVAAASAEKGSWERAKAGLVTLYQEMLSSPDLTLVQVEELIESFKQELLKAHATAASFTLGSEVSSDVLDQSAFSGAEKHARLRALKESHALMNL
jgi:hypothetical protein